MFVFRKMWHALFSCNTHSEIRLFALLPTSGKAGYKNENLATHGTKISL